MNLQCVPYYQPEWQKPRYPLDLPELFALENEQGKKKDDNDKLDIVAISTNTDQRTIINENRTRVN